MLSRHAINSVKKIAISSNLSDVEQMLSRQNFNGMSSFTYKIEGGFVGWLGGISCDQKENLLIMAGEPINGPDILKITDYHAAVRFLPEFDGAFNAVYFDRINRKLVIVSDFLGLQPLYVKNVDDNICIASETKAFGLLKRDLAGWGAFFTWGHLIGDRTLLAGIKRFPAATIFVYDTQNNSKSVNTYWDFPQTTDRYSIDNIHDSFKETLIEYTSFPGESTLLMSGGFDSRLILFSLLAMGIKPNAQILAHDDEYDDLDGKLASSIVKNIGIKCEKITPSNNFYSSKDYLDFLNCSDANTPSLFLFISKIILSFISNKHSACWEGFIPGYSLVVPYHNGIDLKSFVAAKAPESSFAILRKIFKAPIYDEMYSLYQKALDDEVGKYDNNKNSIGEFYLKNKGRHRTSINPLQVYSNFTRPFLPGMSKEFISSSMSIPYDKQKNHNLYLEFLKKIYPEACNVPFISGGKLISLRRNSSYFSTVINAELFKLIQNHPTIFSSLGLYKDFSTKSSFLDSQLLCDDPALNFDFLTKIAPDDPRYLQIRKMVFHWRAWELVHNGNVYDLLNNPGVMDGKL
ncbi:MAG: hypothetical protein PF572_03660 [Patescibacteria group bacterium]|jgi:hypothetical protein|nr:hypothetical protein [Patescibacteria group bacterium]